jgi:hypothetical protein
LEDRFLAGAFFFLDSFLGATFFAAVFFAAFFVAAFFFTGVFFFFAAFFFAAVFFFATSSLMKRGEGDGFGFRTASGRNAF